MARAAFCGNVEVVRKLRSIGVIHSLFSRNKRGVIFKFVRHVCLGVFNLVEVRVVHMFIELRLRRACPKFCVWGITCRQGAYMPSKKKQVQALIERILGAELSHLFDRLPGEVPDPLRKAQ